MELKKTCENRDNVPAKTFTSDMRILMIEPLYGGSHKQFIDTLLEGFNDVKISLYVLPAKKWHWRARTSALYFYDAVPRDAHFDVIFASSVLNLAEFIALRPDLTHCKKILYFHENQLVYPVQQVKERDFQYGYNQILSWEHDKDPQTFFQVVSSLKRLGYTFQLSVVGKAGDNESMFKEAAEELTDYIRTWGYVSSKEDFYTLLRECHVALSTAKHEFFGISMLEAVSCGCFPLCPKSLVYPEIFPDECLYEDQEELLEKLKTLCNMPGRAVEMRNKMKIDLSEFSDVKLIPKYKELLFDQ